MAFKLPIHSRSKQLKYFEELIRSIILKVSIFIFIINFFLGGEILMAATSNTELDGLILKVVAEQNFHDKQSVDFDKIVSQGCSATEALNDFLNLSKAEQMSWCEKKSLEIFKKPFFMKSVENETITNTLDYALQKIFEKDKACRQTILKLAEPGAAFCSAVRESKSSDESDLILKAWKKRGDHPDVIFLGQFKFNDYLMNPESIPLIIKMLNPKSPQLEAAVLALIFLTGHDIKFITLEKLLPNISGNPHYIFQNNYLANPELQKNWESWWLKSEGKIKWNSKANFPEKMDRRYWPPAKNIHGMFTSDDGSESDALMHLSTDVALGLGVKVRGNERVPYLIVSGDKGFHGVFKIDLQVSQKWDDQSWTLEIHGYVPPQAEKNSRSAAMSFPNAHFDLDLKKLKSVKKLNLNIFLKGQLNQLTLIYDEVSKEIQLVKNKADHVQLKRNSVLLAPLDVGYLSMGTSGKTDEMARLAKKYGLIPASEAYPTLKFSAPSVFYVKVPADNSIFALFDAVVHGEEPKDAKYNSIFRNIELESGLESGSEFRNTLSLNPY